MIATEKLKEIAIQIAERKGIDLDGHNTQAIVDGDPDDKRVVVEHMFDSVVTLILQTWNEEKGGWDCFPMIDMLKREDGWYVVEISTEESVQSAVTYDYEKYPVEIVDIDEAVQANLASMGEMWVPRFAAILATLEPA